MAARSSPRSSVEASLLPATDLLVSTELCKYRAVPQAAAAAGWKEAERPPPAPSSASDEQRRQQQQQQQGAWNIFWTDLSVSHGRVNALRPLQKLNHFPDMACICNKATAASTLNRVSKYFPLEFRFFPKSWQLPKEVVALHKLMKPPREAAAKGAGGGGGGGGGASSGDSGGSASGGPSALIVKPGRGCQGADISICRTIDELEEAYKLMGQQCVAQEYMDEPLLIDGYKFDLRLYVCVTSCTPLRIHLYRDGIARLCTEKYYAPDDEGQAPMTAAPGAAAAGGAAADAKGRAAAAVDWRFRHLTNYAINRNHPSFTAGEGGAKRRLGEVLEQLEHAPPIHVHPLMCIACAWGGPRAAPHHPLHAAFPSPLALTVPIMPCRSSSSSRAAASTPTSSGARSSSWWSRR